jgi:hypothetical protein
MWSIFKAKFDSLENRAAGRIERLAQNPFLVGASARALTTFAQSKKTMDRAVAETLGAFGLATKRDQERLMHMVVELQSKLLDIEENLQTRALTVAQTTNNEANETQPLPVQAERAEPTSIAPVNAATPKQDFKSAPDKAPSNRHANNAPTSTPNRRRDKRR